MSRHPGGDWHILGGLVNLTANPNQNANNKRKHVGIDVVEIFYLMITYFSEQENRRFTAPINTVINKRTMFDLKNEKESECVMQTIVENTHATSLFCANYYDYKI